MPGLPLQHDMAADIAQIQPIKPSPPFSKRWRR